MWKGRDRRLGELADADADADAGARRVIPASVVCAKKMPRG